MTSRSLVSARQKYDANLRLTEDYTSILTKGISSLSTANDSAVHLNRKIGYLQSEFLSKFVSSDTDSADLRRERAIEKWLYTEHWNRLVNERLIDLPADFQIFRGVEFSSFITFCQTLVRETIGDMPDDSDFIGGFSGGASTSRNRLQSLPALKYLGQADVTEDALTWWESVSDLMPGWMSFKDDMSNRVVPGNVLFTVPKTTSIDRCACKEPDLNMFMQRGLGARIRKDLRRVGIDLNDQSRNRRYAKSGSQSGLLATLDLSSASDSVCTEFVRLLLPPIWFCALDALRSKVTMIDGVEHSNEMFSSMGNGFTFELESLLFYTLARATAYFQGVSGVISVYGDDLIVPTHLAPDLVFVLNLFGFGVNKDKSFWDGSFRESCGGHYDGGRDITPFYLRKPIETYVDLIHIANSLRKWALIDIRVGEGVVDFLDCNAYPLWCALRDGIPKSLWGGRDLSSKYQLVTPDLPLMVLKPTVVGKATGKGGYVHWLFAAHRREPRTTTGGSTSVGTNSLSSLALIPPDAVMTSQASDVIHRFRPVKAVGTVPRLRGFFVEELLDAEDVPAMVQTS